eukprot:1143519-Pelagomonas_calceolata.AAC.4
MCPVDRGACSFWCTGAQNMYPVDQGACSFWCTGALNMCPVDRALSLSSLFLCVLIYSILGHRTQHNATLVCVRVRRQVTGTAAQMGITAMVYLLFGPAAVQGCCERSPCSILRCAVLEACLKSEALTSIRDELGAKSVCKLRNKRRKRLAAGDKQLFTRHAALSALQCQLVQYCQPLFLAFPIVHCQMHGGTEAVLSASPSCFPHSAS